jgi:hypothetical protein
MRLERGKRKRAEGESAMMALDRGEAFAAGPAAIAQNGASALAAIAA